MYIVPIALTMMLVFAFNALNKLQNVPGEKRSSRPLFSSPIQQNAVDLRSKIPAVFILNTGQTDRRVKFAAYAGGANFYFTPSEAVFGFNKGNSSYALRLTSSMIIRLRNSPAHDLASLRLIT